MEQPDTLLAARDVHKSFGKGAARVHVLRGVDLAVRRGEFVAVMGPSGCGKSTLLHVLGLMTPTDPAPAGGRRGAVSIYGRDVPDSNAARTRVRRKDIGFVFQRFNLLGTLSAADNVAVSLRVRGLSTNGRIESLFDAMGVSHVMRRKPGQMSIGEQQRVAVVRALAHSPALLLADEPTGNLDSGNSTALLELLRSLNDRHGQTIVMITHSAAAAGYAHRVVNMVDGRLTDGHTSPETPAG